MYKHRDKRGVVHDFSKAEYESRFGPKIDESDLYRKLKAERTKNKRLKRSDIVAVQSAAESASATIEELKAAVVSLSSIVASLVSSRVDVEEDV